MSAKSIALGAIKNATLTYLDVLKSQVLNEKRCPVLKPTKEQQRMTAAEYIKKGTKAPQKEVSAVRKVFDSKNGKVVVDKITATPAEITEMLANKKEEILSKTNGKANEMKKQEIEKAKKKCKSKAKKFAVITGVVGLAAGGAAGYYVASTTKKTTEKEIVFTQAPEDVDDVVNIPVNRFEKPEENGFIVSPNGTVLLKDNVANPPMTVEEVVQEDVETVAIPGVNEYVEDLYHNDARQPMQA